MKLLCLQLQNDNVYVTKKTISNVANRIIKANSYLRQQTNLMIVLCVCCNGDLASIYTIVLWKHHVSLLSQSFRSRKRGVSTKLCDSKLTWCFHKIIF